MANFATLWICIGLLVVAASLFFVWRERREYFETSQDISKLSNVTTFYPDLSKNLTTALSLKEYKTLINYLGQSDVSTIVLNSKFYKINLFLKSTADRQGVEGSVLTTYTNKTNSYQSMGIVMYQGNITEWVDYGGITELFINSKKVNLVKSLENLGFNQQDVLFGYTFYTFTFPPGESLIQIFTKIKRPFDTNCPLLFGMYQVNTPESNNFKDRNFTLQKYNFSLVSDLTWKETNKLLNWIPSITTVPQSIPSIEQLPVAYSIPKDLGLGELNNAGNFMDIQLLFKKELVSKLSLIWSSKQEFDFTEPKTYDFTLYTVYDNTTSLPYYCIYSSYVLGKNPFEIYVNNICVYSSFKQKNIKESFIVLQPGKNLIKVVVSAANSYPVSVNYISLGPNVNPLKSTNLLKGVLFMAQNRDTPLIPLLSGESKWYVDITNSNSIVWPLPQGVPPPPPAVAPPVAPPPAAQPPPAPAATVVTPAAQPPPVIKAASPPPAIIPLPTPPPAAPVIPPQPTNPIPPPPTPALPSLPPPPPSRPSPPPPPPPPPPPRNALTFAEYAFNPASVNFTDMNSINPTLEHLASYIQSPAVSASETRLGDIPQVRNTPADEQNRRQLALRFLSP